MAKDLTELFINKVRNCKKPDQLWDKVQAAVADSSAKYLDQPIPFLYQPIFWPKKDIDVLIKASQTITSILEKVVKTYLANPDFRDRFGFDPLTEELILVEPGYNHPAPMARFDLLYHQKDQSFKFCEFNTDGSSGMNEDNVLAKIFLATKAIQELSQEYNLSYFELLESWVEVCLKIYREFSGSIKLPNVAIVDWEGVSTIREFEAFQQAFQKKGCKTIIADPRSLRLKNGKLYKDNLRIDLIYRRLVNHEFVQRQAEIADFVQAYRSQKVCVIGPIRSQIVHNKIIFQLLNDREVQKIFNEQEVAFINKHIPLTHAFKGDFKILELAKSRKNDFVLKPQDLYGSQGVYVGQDLSETDWLEVVEKCWGRDYLLQEFVAPPEIKMLNTKFELETFKHILGIYLYSGQMAGLYSRVGKNNVISTSTGGFVVPNYYFE